MTTPAETTDFIGRGIAFPMRIDGSGRIALNLGGEDMDESIRLILLTAPGERPMRPRFGCRIWNMVYAPMNRTTLGEMAQAVREALAEWEPRIDVESVRVTLGHTEGPPDANADGCALITIAYRIRATNDRRNLVHPFYVIPEEEGRR